MKVIKLFGGVLLGLLFIFLMAGIIIPTVSYQVAIDLNQPLEKTWHTYNDQSKIHRWSKAVKTVESVEEIPGRVGSTFKVLLVENQLPEEKEILGTINSYNEFELVELSFQDEHLHRMERIHFEEKSSNQTQLIKEVEIRGNSYFKRCLLAFQRTGIEKKDAKSLEEFKAYLE